MHYLRVRLVSLYISLFTVACHIRGLQDDRKVVSIAVYVKVQNWIRQNSITGDHCYKEPGLTLSLTSLMPSFWVKVNNAMSDSGLMCKLEQTQSLIKPEC